MELILDQDMYISGRFDSRIRFPGISVTEDRVVPCYELELYDEDCGVTYIGETPYPIRRGTVLCAKPGIHRHSELPLITEYLKLLPRDTELTGMLDELPERFVTDDIDRGLTLLRAIPAVTERSSEFERLARHSGLLAFLVWLFSEAKRCSTGHTRYPKSMEAVGAAIEYMETHFQEKCTLEQVAEAVHLSPVYFHATFKANTGKTPYEYLQYLRIEEAKRMVLNKDRSMAEISELCGFSSQSYFNYVFRRETGYTPLAYCRKMLRQYIGELSDFMDK